MAERMRCYYEVLGVDRKADEDEIRKAYKKAALRCHPDRNHGNEEAAALEFKEVQNAYTVLIDGDERAWYDSHRESILRGEDYSNGGGGGSACAPDELNVFNYFSARCYSNFDDADTEKGFFNVYRTVFETIVKEESEYNDKVGRTAPSFGDSTTPWEKLQPFYTYWKNFITSKTFAWKDEYKLNEINDRQMRREAERINNKARAQARKEYIGVVTQLAHHIYGRDPRVLAEKERAEREREEKAAEREKREAEAAKRRREANKRIWEEAAEQEAKDLAERVARGEDYDGASLEMLYEKQRQMERAVKKGDKKAMREAAGAHSTHAKHHSGEGDGGEEGGGAHVGGGGGARSRIVVGGFATDEDDEEGDGAGAGGGGGGGLWKCMGCKKHFATDKTFQEHIKSSKHKTKFKQLEKQGVDVSDMMITPSGSVVHGEKEKKEDDDEKNNDDDKGKGKDGGKDGKSAAAAAAAKGKGKGKDEAVAPKKGNSSKNSKKNKGDDTESSDSESIDVTTKKGAAAAAAKAKNNKKKGGKGKDESEDEEDVKEETKKPSEKYQKSKVKAAAKAAKSKKDESEDDDEDEEEDEHITITSKFNFGKKKK